MNPGQNYRVYHTPQDSSAPVPSASTLTCEPPTDATLFTAADVAKPVGCHPNTVKEIARALRMDIVRTPQGWRLFTPHQAERIQRELERRRREAFQ